MIDVFLLYLLVSFVPMAFPIGMNRSVEHTLFATWRFVQCGALLGAFVYVLFQLARSRWVDRIILLILFLGALFTAAAYEQVGWDAQIEYNRVILLATRYGGLWTGYAHGGNTWILGYPPGTSLSAMWYPFVHLPSPNMAQMVLVLLWSANFLVRYLRHLDAPSKCLFFALLVSMSLVLWHLTIFYNNLFFALIWAQMIVLPLLGVAMRPVEFCAYALVMIWMRPQFGMTAVPLCSAALVTLLTPRQPAGAVRDVFLRTGLALAVAWFGASYWQRIATHVEQLQNQERRDAENEIAAGQDPHVTSVEVPTDLRVATPPPPPKLFSRQSWDAITWAFDVTVASYRLSLLFLAGAALFALLALRREGLPYLVPLLSPLTFILGTAVFARSLPDYRSNAWALERLQLVTSILAAGSLTALSYRLKRAARPNA